MNIKNRFHKLEERADPGGEFCICPETPKAGLRIISDGADIWERDPIPDFCANCRKPVDKKLLIIQGQR